LGFKRAARIKSVLPISFNLSAGLKMPRIYNFSAGPAALPELVLKQAASEMLDWHGCGMSVMEMSHRGPAFLSIHAKAQQLLRELLNVPAEYKILFLQGGGIGMNAIVPMNLLGTKRSIDFVNTGVWSQKSIEEAGKYAQAVVVASSEPDGFKKIPAPDTWQLNPDAAYVHICANETINGVEYFFTPKTGHVPLVADMSSNILSRPIDVSAYGLIYAGAQKNIGPAGLTIVIVREDLLNQAMPMTPSAFHFKMQAENDSMLNTPPTYSIYIAGLVFEWLQKQGGLEVMAQKNQAKSKALYDYLDASDLYQSPIEPDCRSRMNVPFKLKDESLNDAFLNGAQAQGLAQLKGHRLMGGMRASLYNAMPMEGVEALLAYMRGFEAQNGG
jgi:phosphoserine aminotransferase